MSGTRAIGDAKYNKILESIRKGVEMWKGSHKIYRVSATVSVDFRPTKASSAMMADIVVTTNAEFFSTVPGTFIWNRYLTPTMNLNLGAGGYWDSNGDPTDAVAYIAAHEFGHVLGIFDTYRYPANMVPARPSRSANDGIMGDSIFLNGPTIRDTEIKMMLYAWDRNKLQAYEPTWYGFGNSEESVVFYQSGLRYR